MKFTSLIKLTVAEEPRVALNEKLWFVLENFWGIDGKRRYRSGREMEKYLHVRKHYRSEEKERE